MNVILLGENTSNRHDVPCAVTETYLYFEYMHYLSLFENKLALKVARKVLPLSSFLR